MKNKIIILMTIFSIMFITVAWASFSTTLMITGEGTILTDSTPPTCGAWKLRPSTLTYAEATAQDAFIDPGTNNTWTDDSLILSVDCTDNLQCAFDHYDVKTYNTTTKTDSNALTQVIQDAFSNQTTCTLPVGGSNPYVDKDAPVLTELYVTPMDGEFKTSMNLIDVSTYPAFENKDGAYYTYEGKSFIGTGVNNLIISENIISEAKYASAYGTDNGDGTYTFADHPAADAAASYCTGCRLMTKDEAIAWDSAAGTGNSTKRIGNYNGSASNWWLADAYNIYRALHVSNTGSIIDRVVTFKCGVRPAVTIDSNMKMSGSGTQGDPYVIMPANSNYAESGIVSTQFYYKRCGDQNWTALTKNTFAATTTKAYTDWYIPSNNNTSTTCLSSAWGTYYFRVDVEDAVGNTKTYYSKKTTNSTNPVEGYTENENEMNQFALAPLKARNISYDNTGQPTLCTDVECAHDQLRYMLGLGLTYGITLDNRSATTAGTSVIYENYGDGFYLTNTNGTLSNKMTTTANAITVPTLTGGTFLGYYTEKDGQGTKVIDSSGNIVSGVTATLRRKNTKLYAYWLLPAGLYDTSGNLVKTWAELEGLGLTKAAIETDYTSSNYQAAGTPNEIFTSNNLRGSLILPNTITKIGNYAFYYGYFLESITIPGSVTSIGMSAFSNSGNLSSVTMLDGVSSIGYYAFSYSGIKAIKIPSSITNINPQSFQNMSNLESLVVDSSNTTYDSRNNSNAIIETATNTLIVGCKNTVIPNTVTNIGNYAFYTCKGLTSITIPNTVTSIGIYSFADTKLTTLTIPNSVTTIGASAFANCSELTSLYIGSGTTNINMSSTLFGNSYKLTTIVVDQNNTTYDSRNNCNAIIEKSTNKLIAGCKSTVIPNTVTSIGGLAFNNNKGLTSITIPSSVTNIGWAAFSGCSGLTSATFSSPNNWFVSTESSATSGTNLTLTNSSQNATYLRDTYKFYYWKKSN